MTTNAARAYENFITKLYQRYKHDDGSELRNRERIKVPRVFEFIEATSEKDLARLDPTKPEYWTGPSTDNEDGILSTELPPDPLSDETFKKIQSRVCIRRSYNEILEQSICRCNVPEEELENDAEDIEETDDSFDLEEIEALCEIFEDFHQGVEESLPDADEAEKKKDEGNSLTARPLENSENGKVDDLSLKLKGESTEVKANCKSFAISADPALGNDYNSTATSESFIPEVQRRSGEYEGLELKPEESRKLRRKHPPLHLLTSIQRRLVRLNLY